MPNNMGLRECSEDQDRIKRRLAKVLALSQKGVGGEKTNARAILEKGLAAHGLTLDDIAGSSDPLQVNVRKWYTYRTKADRTILFQCFFAVMKPGDGSVSYRQFKGKKKIAFDVSVLDHLEIDAMHSYYRRLYVKELETLEAAFLSKHRLFDGTRSSEATEMDLEKQMRIMEMMRGLQRSSYLGPKKRLGNGS